MEKLQCSQCGNALENGVAVCGACGNEMKAPGRKNLYAVLTVLLVLLGGTALLVFTGILPSPMKGAGAVAAIVNGEKITIAELDQNFKRYQQMSGKSGPPNSGAPAGAGAAAAEMRMQILNGMIQDKILFTEAVKEKITVSPQEISDKIGEVKKRLNLSDSDFDALLQNHAMTSAGFEKQIEKDLLISKLFAKGVQEKGLNKSVWLAELLNKAKVEIRIRSAR